jgi:hypothetical protein
MQVLYEQPIRPLLLWANTGSQVIVVPTELTGLLRACFLPPTFANCYAVCWGVFGAPIQAALAGGVLKHAVWFPERLPQPSRLDAKCLAESSSGETRVTYYVSLGPCSGEPRAHVVASARESVGAAADMDDGKWWKKNPSLVFVSIYIFLVKTGLGLQTKFYHDTHVSFTAHFEQSLGTETFTTSEEENQVCQSLLILKL